MTQQWIKEAKVDKKKSDFPRKCHSQKLNNKQIIELNSRINSFHKDPSIGKNWIEVKNNIENNIHFS